MVKVHNIVVYIALAWLIIASLLVFPAVAEANDCEKLAKDYQRTHGGDLIFIQPLIPNSGGAYDLGEYNGHWMNRAYNKTLGIYYYDPQMNAYYFTVHSIEVDFEEMWNKDVVVFNYNKGEVPFGLIFHY